MGTVWSRIGNTARHSTPSSRGAGVTSGSSQRCWRGWGSWQRTCKRWSNQRKTTNKDTNRDMMKRWHCFENRAESCSLEPNVSETSVTCHASARECAHACVQAGVPLLLFGRETVRKKKQLPLQQLRSCTDMNSVKNELLCKTANGIRTQVDLDNVELLAHAHSFLRLCWAWLFVLWPMGVPFLPILVLRWRSTMLGLMTRLKLMMMVVGVLNFAVP